MKKLIFAAAVIAVPLSSFAGKTAESAAREGEAQLVSAMEALSGVGMPKFRASAAAPVQPCEKECLTPSIKIENGRLFKNGQDISGGANMGLEAPQVACTGDVAWVSNIREVHKNGVKLKPGVSLGNGSFKINYKSGHVIWFSTMNDLYRDGENLTANARLLNNNYKVTERQGDVIWMDSFSNLYRNSAQIGSSVRIFNVKEDGGVEWTDVFGKLQYNPPGQ